METESGKKFFGTLQESSKRGEMIVGYGKIVVTLKMHEVVRIVPIKSTFWDRMDGSVDIGYSITRADRKTEWSMAADTSHRTR